MSNAVVEALEKAAERVGKTLGKDAGKAVEDMYRQAGKRTEDVVKRISEADTDHARKLLDIVEKLGKNDASEAKSYAERRAQALERNKLRSRFGDVLGEVDEGELAREQELGMSVEARRAITKLENIKKDPLGEINREPNHNHYAAARREANGEIVAVKADGTPFSHISDLQQARDGLDNVRKALEREMENPPDTITERGLDVLLQKYSDTQGMLNGTNRFLQSIGYEVTPPYHSFAAEGSA